MKNLPIPAILALYTIIAVAAHPAARAQPAERFLTDRGEGCTVGPASVIVAEKGLEPLAEYAAGYLKCSRGKAAAGENTIALLVEPSEEDKPESFRIEVGKGHIAVKGADYGGVFNGIQALFRLMPPEIYARKGLENPVVIPCGSIEQAPKFAYRGLMVDVARTWIEPEDLIRYIDLIAYHGINKLHLHLTDDEGWRIEIKALPELARTGGFRGGESPIKPVYGKFDEMYGGFYSQEQMRRIIRYAAVRNIEIIPEIDLPGHSRAIATVHPEIRCRFDPDTTLTAGYDDRSAWCVAREENYRLLETILGEICDLFPSDHIHIGGDEVDFEQWMRCPDCRNLMARMETQSPNRLEDRFIERVAGILERHGKQAAVWNEAVRSGKLDRNTRVHAWESMKACIEATEMGYPTVVMPGEYFYFDMRQSPDEPGHNWAGVFDAEKVYAFDPERAGLSERQMEHVVGLQGAFWSETYVANDPESPDYMDYMLFPRLCALARIAWNGNLASWPDYAAELNDEHFPRLEAMGVRFRIDPPKVVYRDGKLEVGTGRGGDLFYVRDDRPGEVVPCTGEVVTQHPQLYRFFLRKGSGRSPYAADNSYYRTIQPTVKISSSMPESSKQPIANAEKYKGYAFTQRTCRVGDWILYAFDQPVRCREITVQTGYSHVAKHLFTSGYAEVSYDGRNFEPAGRLADGAVTLKPLRPVKAVRVVATCHGNGTPFVVIPPLKIKPPLQ